MHLVLQFRFGLTAHKRKWCKKDVPYNVATVRRQAFSL